MYGRDPEIGQMVPSVATSRWYWGGVRNLVLVDEAPGGVRVGQGQFSGAEPRLPKLRDRAMPYDGPGAATKGRVPSSCSLPSLPHTE